MDLTEKQMSQHPISVQLFPKPILYWLQLFWLNYFCVFLYHEMSFKTNLEQNKCICGFLRGREANFIQCDRSSRHFHIIWAMPYNQSISNLVQQLKVILVFEKWRTFMRKKSFLLSDEKRNGKYFTICKFKNLFTFELPNPRL